MDLPLARCTAVLALVIGLAGCASAPQEKPWRVRKEKVEAGDRERVAAHASWKRRGEVCEPRPTPRLQLVEAPAHGRVEFGKKRRKPKKCRERIEHATVYYEASPRYSGRDRFSYHRIDPVSGKRRLVVVEVRVRERPRAAGEAPASRELVREIQQRLADAGYEPGPVDGLVGRRTRSAIEQYERARGLPVAGRPSAELLENLRREP